MVKAEDSWIFQYPPAWKPPDLNGNQNGTGALHEPNKQGLMTSYVYSGALFSPSLAKIQGRTVPEIPNSNVDHLYTTAGPNCFLPLHCRDFPHALDPHLKGSASFVTHEPGGIIPAVASSEKRFLVFDRSEKGTRLIYGSSSPVFPKSDVIGTKPHYTMPVEKGEHPTSLSQFDWDYPSFHEEFGENQVDGEESEMYEDTEEINALLYSDDEYEHAEEDGEDEEDEVTSTGHTPDVLRQRNGKRNQAEDSLDEDGNAGRLNKRQKSIAGGYNCFVSLHTEAPMTMSGGSREQKSDANSSSVMSRAKVEEKFSHTSNELSKTDKIGRTMKILEGIVPGAEGKDPVAILDEAIDYLKTMRLKAKVLGTSFR